MDAEALLREGKARIPQTPPHCLKAPQWWPAVQFRQGVLWGSLEKSGREGASGPLRVSPDSWVSSFLLSKCLTQLWLLSTHSKHGDLE